MIEGYPEVWCTYINKSECSAIILLYMCNTSKWCCDTCKHRIPHIKNKTKACYKGAAWLYRATKTWLLQGCYIRGGIGMVYQPCYNPVSRIVTALFQPYHIYCKHVEPVLTCSSRDIHVNTQKNQKSLLVPLYQGTVYASHVSGKAVARKKKTTSGGNFAYNVSVYTFYSFASYLYQVGGGGGGLGLELYCHGYSIFGSGPCPPPPPPPPPPPQLRHLLAVTKLAILSEYGLGVVCPNCTYRFSPGPPTRPHITAHGFQILHT